jgi:ribonuclease J
MTLEIIPLGGFSEVGRNCTAVKVDDEIVILDMGLMLDKYIEYTESDEIVEISAKKLIQVGAVPDINLLGDLRKNVVAICVSHGHLDHVGAIPYLASRLDADIHATPMTCEVIRNLSEREGAHIRNKIVEHGVDSRFRVSRRIEIEFVYLTHSIPQTVAIFVHTPYGTVAYLNDFKLDMSPTLGPKSNLKRLLQLKGVTALVLDSLYANVQGKAKSEKIAQQMLFDQVLGTDTRGKTVVITTFSSHIARLKSICDLSKRMGRKTVIFGRSMDKYISAAANSKVIDLRKEAQLVPYRQKVDDFLKNAKDLSKYILVMTGHQGEPKAVLSRTFMKGALRLKPDDLVVFSSTTIPVNICIENRSKLEEALRQKHVRIFADVHVSGHGAKEDLRDIIKILKPKHLIPTHGEISQLGSLKNMAVQDMGYDPTKVHILSNGQRIRIA